MGVPTLCAAERARVSGAELHRCFAADDDGLKEPLDLLCRRSPYRWFLLTPQRLYQMAERPFGLSRGVT